MSLMVFGSPLGTVVNDLDVVKVKIMIVFIQCWANKESPVKIDLLCSLVLDLGTLGV